MSFFIGLDPVSINLKIMDEELVPLVLGVKGLVWLDISKHCSTAKAHGEGVVRMVVEEFCESLFWELRLLASILRRRTV